jgi:hypothetical protein
MSLRGKDIYLFWYGSRRLVAVGFDNRTQAGIYLNRQFWPSQPYFRRCLRKWEYKLVQQTGLVTDAYTGSGEPIKYETQIVRFYRDAGKPL